MNKYCLVLCHHGVKGQKWGVRRYQNKDGSLTELGKRKKDMDAINDIVSTMSKKDRDMMNLSGKVYQENLNDERVTANRIIKKVGNVPVAFF